MDISIENIQKLEGGYLVPSELKHDIIYSEETNRIVSSLFPGIIDSEEIAIQHKTLFNNNWVFLETEKVMFLYSSKVGSSFIRNSIVEPNNARLVNIVNNGPVDIKPLLKFKPFTLEPNIEECDFSVSELVKFLNGNSKKDLILLIRNPVMKWISGVVMDMRNNEITSPLFHAVLEKAYNRDFRGLGFEDLPEDILSELTYFYIRDIVKKEGRVDNGHSRFFAESNYLLFSEHIDTINLNKLKIFDVDELGVDLGDVITEYYPILKDYVQKDYWTQRTLWNKLFSEFVTHISNRNDNLLMDKIQDGVYKDYSFYKMFKQKFKSNLIN